MKTMFPDFVAGQNEPEINRPSSQVYAKQFIEKCHLNVREHKPGAKPPFGLTAVIGPKGSGKTLTAAWLCRLQYMKGVPVHFTPTAGLRFGVEIGNVKHEDGDALNELYAFAMDKKDCIIFIDELQVYLNKWGQNAIGHQLFIDCLAALRKNNVHVIYTCQHDGQISSDLKTETTAAYFPAKVPYKLGDEFKTRSRKRRRRDKPERTDFVALPGRYRDLHIRVTMLHGATALSFNQPPNMLMQYERRSLPRPKRLRFRIPYPSAVETAILYNSWSELQVGARFMTNAKIVREVLQ